MSSHASTCERDRRGFGGPLPVAGLRFGPQPRMTRMDSSGLGFGFAKFATGVFEAFAGTSSIEGVLHFSA